MLVLTRKYQEKIRIGENITITVLRMKGKAVRLGIEAPADVPVVRGELAFEAETEADVESENEEADQEAVDEFPTRGRQFARIAAAGGEWTTDSNPTAAARSNSSHANEKIEFSRVRREQVAEVLPTLVSGTAPLRAMMGRQ